MSDDPPDSDRLSRSKQKQLSRERDAMLLQSGQITAAELKRKNSFFGALPIKRYKMVAIGGKPVGPL